MSEPKREQYDEETEVCADCASFEDNGGGCGSGDEEGWCEEWEEAT